MQKELLQSQGTGYAGTQAVGHHREMQWTKQEQCLQEQKVQPSPVRPSQFHLSTNGVLIHAGKEWKEVKLASAYQTGAKTGVKGGLKQAGYCASFSCPREFGSFGRLGRRASVADSGNT